jgi:hypothetical protein
MVIFRMTLKSLGQEGLLLLAAAPKGSTPELARIGPYRGVMIWRLVHVCSLLF